MRTWIARRWREPQRVLEQVREHALDLHRIDADERRLAGDVDAIRVGPRSSTPRRTSSSTDHTSGSGSARARFEPREVEQVADEPREPVGVDGDRLEQLRAVGVGEDELVVPQTRRSRS